MKYFFVLGSNPTLSVAEIYSVFSLNQAEIPALNTLIIEADHEIMPELLINRLGGTIKIGLIRETMPLAADQKTALDKIFRVLENKKTAGKFKFGLSWYSPPGKLNLKIIGMELKKMLSSRGISSRWVTSREPVLSSVVVTQNKLIKQGAEIILIKDKNNLLIGETLAVQPFKELSRRDYGRPARDDYSGMLPPKLAQMMINLALPNSFSLTKEEAGKEAILDPFCGSGTILTEAMLMGYKDLIGSDISAKAIEDTKKNIEWIKNNYEVRSGKYELLNKNALELFKFITPATVDVIITEPYLGPPRGKTDITKIKLELENLYSRSLAAFHKILKPSGRVVMVWPVFRDRQRQTTLNPALNGFKIKRPIPDELAKSQFIKLTPRQTIIYGRPEQKVWREIVVMEK